MDENQIILIIVPPLCAGFGFLCKYILDKRNEYLQKMNKKKLEEVEFKLKRFYFPIHSNLLRENTIWNKILAFYRSINDENKALHHKLFWELDREMLDIHLENQKIIKDNFVEINPNEALSNCLMKYDEHVTIYNIIRKVETDRPDDMDDVKWPSAFGSNYPYEIVDYVNEQLKILKEKQNELMYTMV
jgi:hypothetical protein